MSREITLRRLVVARRASRRPRLDSRECRTHRGTRTRACNMRRIVGIGWIAVIRSDSADDAGEPFRPCAGPGSIAQGAALVDSKHAVLVAVNATGLPQASR
jgi:hypothetical protein